MTIRYETANAVARLTIDRAAVRNALSLETARELRACLARVDDDPDVRAVVLTGAGDRAFASGADLNELPALVGTPEAARRYDAVFEEAYAALESCRVPTIARIQGHTIGGGCLLALACDLRIAASRVSFAVPAVRVGVGLSPSEVRRLVRSLGPWRARWLLFTGARLTAAEAQAWGLVERVVPADELDATVDRVVDDIRRGAPLAIHAAKRLVGAACDSSPIDERLAQEAYEAVYGSADFHEGLRAFLEKRPPRFRGLSRE
jgi:enoyl-CoA hydratase/carnithine racemase